VITFCVWVFTALKVERPLIDLKMFRNIHYVTGAIVSFLVGVCLFGSNFLMPLFMDNLLNYSVLRIAVAMAPGVALSILTTRIGGVLSDRFSPRFPTIMGLFFWAVFTYAFSLNDLRASLFALATIILLRGTGLGLSYTPSMTGAILTLPPVYLGAAAGLLSLAFTLGGMFGIAILGTMLEFRELIHYANYAANQDYSSYSTGVAINALQSFFTSLGHTTAQARGLAVGVLKGIVGREAVVSAFQDSFIFLSLTALIAVIPAFFLKDKNRR
jgi:DHA2 family multidrug resistance protein